MKTGEADSSKLAEYVHRASGWSDKRASQFLATVKSDGLGLALLAQFPRSPTESLGDVPQDLVAFAKQYAPERSTIQWKPATVNQVDDRRSELNYNAALSRDSILTLYPISTLRQMFPLDGWVQYEDGTWGPPP